MDVNIFEVVVVYVKVKYDVGKIVIFGVWMEGLVSCLEGVFEDYGLLDVIWIYLFDVVK